MPFVQIKDVVHHYVIEGPDAAPTIVFANSLGTDLRIWDGVLAHLRGRFRIVRYDKRRHGLTDVTSSPYTIDVLADDLVALLDILKIDEAVICGLSIGGMIAQAFAAAHPQRVRALVRCDTATRIGSPKMSDERIAAIQKDGFARMAGEIMERWFTRDFRDKRDTELQGYTNMLLRTPVEGYIGACYAFRDADLSEAARSIRKPSLVLCGNEDIATPADLVASLTRIIPGARFSLIKITAHLPCVEQPEAVGHIMMQFFEENGAV